MSTPILAAGEVVVVGPASVYGIDPADGHQRWSIARTPGPTTTPATVSLGRSLVLLYTEGSSKTDSRLVAVDLSTRKPIWPKPLALDDASHSGVTVDGTTAFVGDDSGNVYAVDATSGSLRWSATLTGGVQAPLEVAGGLVYAAPQDRLFLRTSAGPTPSVSPSPSPSPTAQAIGSGTGPSLVALSESTGERAWVYAPPTPALMASIPVAAGGSVFFVLSDTSLTGELVALSAKDGSVLWTHRGLGLIWQTVTPIAGEGAIFVADSRGGLWKLDAKTGARLFDFQFNAPVRRSSPVLVGGNAVLLGLGDGRLVAVDAATGRETWGSPKARGLIGGIAVGGDLVVVAEGGRRGGVVAYERDPAGRLVDLASPSTVNLPRLLGNFVGALALVTVVLALPLGYISRRQGSPEFVADEEASGDEDAAGEEPDKGEAR